MFADGGLSAKTAKIMHLEHLALCSITCSTIQQLSDQTCATMSELKFASLLCLLSTTQQKKTEMGVCGKDIPYTWSV